MRKSRKDSRYSGGREQRLHTRLKMPKPNPCPPGQRGGAFSPLNDGDIQLIITSSLYLLENLGMGNVPKKFAEQAIRRGAFMNDKKRLCFPPALIEDIIANACKKFTFFGRNEKYHLQIGVDKTYFGTGGAAVQVLDLGSNNYRNSTLQDLYDFTRLSDYLTNISWFTRCCVATDINDLCDLDFLTAYALFKGTEKPVGTSFSYPQHVDVVMDMVNYSMGDGNFQKTPCMKAHISPIVSPMRYGEDAILVSEACIRHSIPLNVIIAAQAGATAPAPLAAMLTQTTAETLAALAMVDILSPGYPLIFSNWPFVLDLRTGSFSGGGGEIALLNAGAAQISNHLGLISGISACMSDAKSPNNQMGVEKAITALTAGLAGGNMVYEAAGMTAALLGASFQSFVLDDEMLSHVYRIMRGIEVSSDNIDLDRIEKAILGEGHFLGGAQTLESMQRDYFYPEIADRTSPAMWEQLGSVDVKELARMKVVEIFEKHRPNYLGDKDADIRRKMKNPPSF